MGSSARSVEEMLAGIAGASHGVVTRRQLLEAGLTLKEIRHRLHTGALLREYPGVYRVGHRAPSIEAIYLSAVWACGPGDLLSGRPAGHLLYLLRGTPPDPQVTTRTERRIAGLHTIRCRRLDPRDGTIWRGVPVTTVPRTLVDLAAELGDEALARACHEAGVRYGTTPAQVEAVLQRRPNAPGARRLRRILYGDVHLTLSRLESRFLERLREASLPLPRTNRRVGNHYIDCRWAEPPLTVELDSYRYHRSRHAWEQDRLREREARAGGDEFRRYTWADVFEAPGYMLRELEELLASSPRRRPG